MSKIKTPVGFWPTPIQQLLLKAILLDGKLAIDYWQQWQSSQEIIKIDAGSQRLLPMLYKKLKAFGVEHADLKLYKGVYSQTWYKNQTLIHQMLPLLRALKADQIDVIILKGVALVLNYYKDHGLRPMSDFDLLVPEMQKLPAISRLTTLGWQSKFSAPYAECFTSAQYECDLHWHLLLECCQPDADNDLWQAAIPLQIQDIGVFTLDPADMLLHICVHGAWWNPTASLRWIVDVMTILQGENSINWSRLIEQTCKRRLILPITNSLLYLKEHFAAPIPSEVLDLLKQLPVTYLEKLDYQCKTRPTKQRSPIAALWVCYREYQQAASSNRGTPQLTGFLKFLQNRWKIDKLRDLPLHSLNEIRQRIRRN